MPERELEISSNNTDNYQSFIDSGPETGQNCEGREFSLSAPDSQCLLSSLFPIPPLCPFSGSFSSTIITSGYLIFLLVCAILKSMLYLQDYLPF